MSGEAVPAKVTGIAGAPGIAIGTAVVVSPSADLYSVPKRQAENRRKELRAFKEALDCVRADIQAVADNLGTELSPEDHALFDVYLGILDDSTIGAEVAGLIKAGQWAQGALSQVMIEHIRHFERMEHSYLKERAVDVKAEVIRMILIFVTRGCGGVWRCLQALVMTFQGNPPMPRLG